MMAKMDEQNIYIKDCDSTQFSIIRSWNKMKYDRKSKMLVGPCEIELLNKLAEMVRLPDRMERYRQKLNRIQLEVDKIRNADKAEPIIKPPVKVSLFNHQAKALNMALITFGVVDVGGGTNDIL